MAGHDSPDFDLCRLCHNARCEHEVDPIVGHQFEPKLHLANRRVSLDTVAHAGTVTP